MRSGNAVAGGVLRDRNGDWVLGYNRVLGNCSIFDAKLWGILDGLKIIQRRGHDKVTIQSNTLEIIKAIYIVVCWRFQILFWLDEYIAFYLKRINRSYDTSLGRRIKMLVTFLTNIKSTTLFLFLFFSLRNASFWVNFFLDNLLLLEFFLKENRSKFTTL